MTDLLHNAVISAAQIQFEKTVMKQPFPKQKASAGVAEFLAEATARCFLAAAVLFAFVLIWLYTIIDLMRSDFKVATNKITWLLLILFIALLGVLLYWIIGSKQKIAPLDPSEDVDTSYRGRRHDW